MGCAGCGDGRAGDREDFELRILRERVGLLEEQIDRLGDILRRDQHALLCVTATDGSYPSAGKMFKLIPQLLTGTEKEGATPVKTARADAIYAADIKSTGPSVGTTVLAVLVPYRWVFV